MTTISGIYMAVLGICLGSFVNALVWRLRIKRQTLGLDKSMDVEEEEPLRPLDIVLAIVEEVKEWLTASIKAVMRLFGVRHNPAQRHKRGTENDKYSITKGRSMCPHCEHQLGAFDLVPVLSWIWLRGKCRYCQERISAQYPLVELITGGLFLMSFLWWNEGFGVTGIVLIVVWFISLVTMVALSLYDAKFGYLPNELVYPLIWLALTWVGLRIFADGTVAAVGAASGVLTIWGMFYIIFWLGEIIGKPLIGYGDVRLAVAIGLFVGGALKAVLVIFFASLIGLVVTIPYALRSKGLKDLRTPFGPSLLAGTVIVVLTGQQVIDWYFGLIGL